jgi:hypothetical protein
MKPLALMSLLLSLLIFHVFAHADGNCPQGYYSIGGQDVQGCAPIPGYGQQQPSRDTAAPPPQWESRWGAIATDAPKGVIGSSSGAQTENNAETEAISDCRSKGGANCTLKATYSNGCGVLLVSDQAFNVNWGPTEAVAIQNGMEVCKKGGNGCRVYFTSCSPAVRIQ